MINEKRVLKKLKIENLSQIQENGKIEQFLSLLPKIDPKVVTKAIELAPDFKPFVSDVLGCMKDFIQQSDKQTELIYAQCSSTLDSLRKELNQKDISEDYKKCIIEEIDRILQNMMEIKKKNDQLKLNFSRIASYALGIFMFCMMVSEALSKILENHEDTDDEEDCA